MIRVLAVLLLLMVSASAEAKPSLKGSLESVQKAYDMALRNKLSFLATGGEIRRFVAKGWRIQVAPSETIVLHDVSYPYATEVTALFVTRLAHQYKQACNEQLVVTSLMRPLNQQPKNASNKSVHPTGAAIDFRIPQNGVCRQWLESTLLSLEGVGLLDVTLERFPPHYHVVVYQTRYAQYVSAKLRRPVTQSRDPITVGIGPYGWLIAVVFLLFGAWYLWTYKRKFVYGTFAVVGLFLVLILEPFSGGHWLGQVIYHEARGESLYGQRAVVSVAFNRVESKRFPDSVVRVITDGTERGRLCDFSFYCDGRSDYPWLFKGAAWGTWIKSLAKGHLAYLLWRAGLWLDPTDGALYYKRKDADSPWFASNIRQGTFIEVAENFGNHHFFKRAQ